MRFAGVIVSSAALLATAIPLTAQERSEISRETRAELRKMIREEVRAALRDLHGEHGRGGKAEHGEAEDRFEWHSDAGDVHVKGLVARAHKALAKAHAENSFVFEIDDEHEGDGGFWAEAHPGHGKTHKTFTLPGGKGKVMFMREGDGDGEANVEVRVETDDKAHKTFTLPGHGHGHGGNVMFHHKGHDGHKGGTFEVKTGGKAGNVKWFGKNGDKMKSFSLPGGKGKVMFMHEGDGAVFDVKAHSVIDLDCCEGVEGCCSGAKKAESECPHPIEVHTKVKRSDKGANCIHV